MDGRTFLGITSIQITLSTPCFCPYINFRCRRFSRLPSCVNPPGRLCFQFSLSGLVRFTPCCPLYFSFFHEIFHLVSHISSFFFPLPLSLLLIATLVSWSPLMRNLLTSRTSMFVWLYYEVPTFFLIRYCCFNFKFPNSTLGSFTPCPLNFLTNPFACFPRSQSFFPPSSSSYDAVFLPYPSFLSIIQKFSHPCLYVCCTWRLPLAFNQQMPPIFESFFFPSTGCLYDVFLIRAQNMAFLTFLP